MKTSESLKKLIEQRSAHKKGFAQKIKATRGQLAVNKMVRCGLADTLKNMKADLKQADRDGEFELASAIRCMINATRTQLHALLAYKKMSEKMLAFIVNQIDELATEIKALDAAWEQAKADEVAAKA